MAVWMERSMRSGAALAAIAAFVGCGGHGASEPSVAALPAPAKPPPKRVGLPSMRVIERYCVAATTCIPSASWSNTPLPQHALSVCVRDVVRTIASTTLIEGNNDWLRCGRRSNDCVAFLKCLASDAPGTKTCLDKAPTKACVTRTVTAPNGEVRQFNIAIECPSRFLHIVMDCSASHQVCEPDGAKSVTCVTNTGKACSRDMSTSWFCRGKDRVRCENGVLHTSRCPYDRDCTDENGEAVCASTEAPCPASDECDGNTGELCVAGARRRVLCDDEWTCRANSAATNAAGPCTVTTKKPCDEATYAAHCVDDELEYCIFGGVRRVSCAKMTRGTCDASAAGGPLCATP